MPFWITVRLTDPGSAEDDEEGVDEEGVDEEGVDEEGVDEEGVDEEGVDEGLELGLPPQGPAVGVAVAGPASAEH